jgi:hypothetical protein
LEQLLVQLGYLLELEGRPRRTDGLDHDGIDGLARWLLTKHTEPTKEIGEVSTPQAHRPNLGLDVRVGLRRVDEERLGLDVRRRRPLEPYLESGKL